MTIETRHNLNEEVWALYENKAINRGVAYISWDSTNGVYYRLKTRDREDPEDFIFKESLVFKNKEELLQSL